MTLVAPLLTVALTLPPPWYREAPETPDRRRERIELIVEATVDATESPPAGWPGAAPDLAAAVLAKTWWESRRWSLEVHDGRVRGDDGRSCGLGQTMHRCRTVGTGYDETRAHLRDVAEILAYHARRCGVREITEHSIAIVFAGYGSGYACHPLRSLSPRTSLWLRFRDAAVAEWPGTQGLGASISAEPALVRGVTLTIA